MAELYTARLRIRALEVALFTSSTIEQLMGRKTEEQALQFLTEKRMGRCRYTAKCRRDFDQRAGENLGDHE